MMHSAILSLLCACHCRLRAAIDLRADRLDAQRYELDRAAVASGCRCDLHQRVQRRLQVGYFLLNILNAPFEMTQFKTDHLNSCAMNELEVRKQAASDGLVADDNEVVLRALHFQNARLQSLHQVVVRLAAGVSECVYVINLH